MTSEAAMGGDEPRLLVRGGRRLSGQVTVSGAKNSALKLMAASLLGPGTSVLHNVPDIDDVHTMKEVLEHLGATVEFADGTLTVDTSAVQSQVAPYDLVQRMRASIQIMGPLVARFGRAKVAMPGGCNLGPRKIDIHLRGLADMGGEVRSDHGFVEVTAPKLQAIDMFLDYPSVGATENLLMAAVLAEGTTTLENVAREPEIVDLCKFLVSMGAEIEGAGTLHRADPRGGGDAPGRAHGAGRPHRSRNVPGGGGRHRRRGRGHRHQSARARPVPVQAAVGRGAGAREHAQHQGQRGRRVVPGGRRGHAALSRASPPTCRLR